MERENWKLFLDKEHSPFQNMAIDELLLEECFELKKPILRFYGWDRKAASIGYIQKYEAVSDNSYTVVRRPTGGGVVFHDVDLTYTVVIPKDHEIEKLNRVESYHIFHRAIIKSFYFIGVDSSLVNYETSQKDRMMSQCFTAPTKYDVILNDNSSSKAAGAAQRRTKKGILHQGSIVLDGISTFSENLIRYIIESFKKEFRIDFENYVPDDFFFKRADMLAEEKYQTEEWNRIR